MRILVAPDKFKDALSAEEAATAIEEGIKTALPTAEITLLPLADGGEGTSVLLTGYHNGKIYHANVQGPLGEERTAQWGYAEEKKMAFLELAQASGFQLVPAPERNPLLTSTFGTGQLMAEALLKGARQIIIGLGGSATNDGGTGMAAALGYRFLDERGKEILFPGGKDLVRIRDIDFSKVNPLLKECRITAAYDVENPLLGPTGAVYTFARQKGATEKMLPLLEEGLSNLARIIKKDLGKEVDDVKGAGAAGGMGAGIIAFAGGELSGGADLILTHSNFESFLQHSDLLITGEGSLDASSLGGKLISRLCRSAGRKGVPVIAFCGTSKLLQDQAQAAGLKTFIPVSEHEPDLPSALRNTARNLRAAAGEYFLKNPF